LAELEQSVGEDVRLFLNTGRCARISLIADGESQAVTVTVVVTVTFSV
jgi:hypothetical protein